MERRNKHKEEGLKLSGKHGIQKVNGGNRKD